MIRFITDFFNQNLYWSHRTIYAELIVSGMRVEFLLELDLIFSDIL